MSAGFDSAGTSTRVNGISWFGWVVGFICIWGFFFPHPYDLCMPVLLLMPAMGLALSIVYHEQWRWTGNWGFDTVWGNQAICTSMIVALAGLRHGNFLDWRSIWLVGGVAALAAFVLVLLLKHELRDRMLAVVAVCCLLYGFGGAAYLNRAFDTQVQQTYHVRVLGMQAGPVSPTGGVTQSFELGVTPWGSYASPNWIEVDWELYFHVFRGETICVYVHPGRLRMPWRQYGLCK